MKQPNFYKDKIVIVTGGGSGLGRALCINLAEYKAQVICTDKDLELAEETVKIIHSKIPDNSSQAVQIDVTNTQQIAEVINSIGKESGKIDYLFNNAGISIGGEIRDLEINHWKKVMDVNLLGLIACATEAFRFMRKIKQGHIVNITSISGLLEYTAVSTPYAVSKHGAVTFSKALRLEALDFNVKVTTVCPGTVKTMIGKNMEVVHTNQQGKQRPIDFVEKGISPELASKIILKGIIKNKKLIVFPTPFKIYYYVTKIFKFIDKNMTLKLIREFRKNDRLE